MTALERRAFEFRTEEDGSVLAGVALPYGSKGSVGRFTEEFRAGSLDFAPSGVFLNVMHVEHRLLARYPEGGLELRDTDKALELRVRLPDTTEGRDAREMVKSGVYRGFSVEFRAQKDRWEGTHRIVEKAQLAAIGLVHAPAYAGATVVAGAEMRSEKYLAGAASPVRRMRIWRSL